MAAARRTLFVIAAPAFWIGGGSAEAHGFAARYDLPIPLGMYLTGAGAAVALSFVVMALFARRAGGGREYPRFDLTRLAPFRALLRPMVRIAAQAVGVAVLVLVVVAGLIGEQNPMRNIAPATVWVVWWVGLAYLCALIGNVWAPLNPWRAAFDWVERLVGRRLGMTTYPAALAAWPAVVLFLCFTWIELVWPGSEAPASLAWAIVLYSILTWAGMALFGARDWVRGGEVFSLAFALFARFSPTETRVTSDRACHQPPRETCPYGTGDGVDCAACFATAPNTERQWNLRPYAAGLLARAPVHASLAAFVICMLATVTFDGFLETPLWLDIKTGILSTKALFPILRPLRDWTGDLTPVLETAGLVSFPVLFAFVYLAVCWATARLAGAGTGITTGQVARWFVLSLVPIAIAYHLAHYLSYFLIAGQLVIRLISDPFGFGWDLFGTADYRLDIGIINARTVWYVSVAAIVIGHMVAVVVAHVTALRLFQDARRALVSQFPMVALMIGYTTLSLWILAQPIVRG